MYSTLTVRDAEIDTMPASDHSYVDRFLGKDITARTMTIITLLIRFLIVGMLFQHYVLGLSGPNTEFWVKFFSTTGSMMVGMIRWLEFMNYQEGDPRRAKRALRSIPLSIAFAALEGWQLLMFF